MKFLNILLSIIFSIILTTSANASTQKSISLIRDDETENFLRDTSESVFSAAGLDPDSIKIIVVNDPSINAFVTAGQKLFIHTGLIMESEKAAGLIGVIAHEAGHIKGAHTIQKGENIKDAGIGSIAGYVLGLGTVLAGAPPEAGFAIGSAGQNIATRNFLAYSRDYENAADTVAVNILSKVGISPIGLVDILRELMRKQKISGDIVDQYMLTHPVSEERINFIMNYVKQNPESDRKTLEDLERRYERVRAKLIGFLETPQKTNLIYQGKNSDDAIYAKSIAFHKQGKFEESMTLLNSLISKNPEDRYYNELKAQFLFERGDIQASVNQYRKVLNIAPNSALVRLKLAEAMIATNNKSNIESAIGQLKAALTSEPKNYAIINKIGIAYGKLGDLGKSYLYLAESSIVIKNILNGRKYLALAEQTMQKNPENIIKLQELKKELDRLKDK
jgi:predicted Zn-dependent protease